LQTKTIYNIFLNVESGLALFKFEEFSEGKLLNKY